MILFYFISENDAIFRPQGWDFPGHSFVKSFCFVFDVNGHRHWSVEATESLQRGGVAISRKE